MPSSVSNTGALEGQNRELSGLKKVNTKRRVFISFQIERRGPERRGPERKPWPQGKPLKRKKDSLRIAMRFLNASVLARKSLSLNLSWGFPFGNLLPNARALKRCVLERQREPNANASVLGTLREWPRCCRNVYWTKMAENGPNDHFGQNDLIPNWILAFARPKWTKMVHFGPFALHFGPFRSANRTLAIPERFGTLRLRIANHTIPELQAWNRQNFPKVNR